MPVFTVILFGIMSTILMAHPVTWKGGQAMVVQSHGNRMDATYHYSITAHQSLGGRIMRLNGHHAYIGQYHWLANRWMSTQSQANAYGLFGIGYYQAKPLLYLGTQTDWETQRVYTMATVTYHSIPMIAFVGRIGFAPYIGAFDDLHTWIMVQLNHTTMNDTATTSIMPVIRFFKHALLVELGSNGNTGFASMMMHF